MSQETTYTNIKAAYVGKKKIPYFHLMPSFDPYLEEDFYCPIINSEVREDELESAVNERIKQLIPDAGEIANSISTASKLCIILDRLRLNPEKIDACKIQNFAMVGSARLGTMIRGNHSADVSIVLQTLPAKASLYALGNKLVEELQNIDPLLNYQYNVKEAQLEIIETVRQDLTKVLVTTIYENIPLLDRNIHIPKRFAHRYLDAIEHVKFIEAQTEVLEPKVMNDIKNLVRLMKDLRKRFDEFQLLSPWMIIVLSHYSTTHTIDRQPLPVHIAFKRIIELLSGGVFLPYTIGIVDPVDHKMPLHGRINVYEQERVTLRAQTLLRALNFNNGIRFIVGLDTDKINEHWDEQFSLFLFANENVVFCSASSVLNRNRIDAIFGPLKKDKKNVIQAEEDDSDEDEDLNEESDEEVQDDAEDEIEESDEDQDDAEEDESEDQPEEPPKELPKLKVESYGFGSKFHTHNLLRRKREGENIYGEGTSTSYAKQLKYQRVFDESDEDDD